MLPGRGAEVNKKTGASLCCWGWGVTPEIGTGLSWGRLPEWLARRTERPLWGLCAKKKKKMLSQAGPHPSSSPPTPCCFFSLSLKTHTNAYTHTCLYLPAAPRGRGFRFSWEVKGGEYTACFVVKIGYVCIAFWDACLSFSITCCKEFLTVDWSYGEMSSCLAKCLLFISKPLWGLK